MDILFLQWLRKKNRNKGFSKFIETTSRGHYKPIGGCLHYSQVHLILPRKKCWLLKLAFRHSSPVLTCDLHNDSSNVTHFCCLSPSIHIHAGEVSPGSLSSTSTQLQHLLSDGWRPLTWGEQHPLPQQCPVSPVGIRETLIVNSIAEW